MEATQIIVRPVITEKSNAQKLASNKVTFEVDRRANKSEIKKAIEVLYKVKVVKINTTTLPGKSRRFGASSSLGSRWKKATATLKAGESIQFFEGA